MSECHSIVFYDKMVRHNRLITFDEIVKSVAQIRKSPNPRLEICHAFGISRNIISVAFIIVAASTIISNFNGVFFISAKFIYLFSGKST